MQKLIIFLIAFVSSVCGFSQNPEWTDFNSRKQLYPETTYFTGFSWDIQQKDESPNLLLGRLKDNAVTELIESVQVTVESETVHNTLELNDEIREQFKQASTSFSRVDLTGLTTVSYFNPQTKTGYALAYVSKNQLKIYYENQMKQYLEKIREHIVLAEQYTRQNNESKAMQEYFSCMPLLRESEEAMAMIILLSASQINSEEIYSYNRKVKTAIEEIYRSEQLDLEEVCRFMVDGLKSQTGKFSSPVLLSNFTFEDTRMGSPFSRRLKNELEQELIRSGNYPIVSEMEFSGNHKDINNILTGTYWEDGTRLRILAILRESSSGKPLASIDGYLPVKWLQEQSLSWKPENFAEAQENMMAFTKNEITGGGLKLDVWTNKGDDSPVFVEGDTLKFYLRVNHPCNVRIINHFADGSKVLLYDNYPVSTALVNKVIELPKEFICSSPFGVEILQVNAQSREFPPLKTESRYGYDFITDELNVILAKTRGFKPVTNEDLKAEKRIVVTTMNDND